MLDNSAGNTDSFSGEVQLGGPQRWRVAKLTLATGSTLMT